MTFDELQKALQILGLRERSTIGEIKTRHRELVKRYHPDSCGDDGDKIRDVNAAYRVLLDYITEYRFSFAEAEFYEQNPEENMRRQFMDSPLWGGHTESGKR
ncbi:MAG: J domain-containing protein [Desulfuromonadaceae bacterium]|nr:J domain-containing protein [Desulfuromonadaceae bacterium]